MKRSLLMTCVGLWFIVGSFFFIDRAQAFEVSPAISDISMMSGSSTQRELSVKNSDNKTQTYFLTVQKFISGGGGQPEFLDPSDTAGLPSWIRVTDQQFTLEPGEKKNIKIVIDVPTDAPSGGAYAAVFITEKPQQAALVGISKRITSLFLVAVNRDSAPAKVIIQKIEQQYIDDGGWKQWLIPSGTGSLNLNVHNAGGSHGVSVVESRVTTWGMRGKQTRDFSQVIRLLPNEARELTFSWRELSLFERIRSDVRINGVVQSSGVSSVHFLRSTWLYLVVVLTVGGVVWFWKRRK